MAVVTHDLNGTENVIVFRRFLETAHALELAPVLSALVDALTRRALELVSANGTPAGEGVVWVSLGSQARRELTPASTRRGAVIHDPATPPAPEWLVAVQAALTHCGVHGPVVARDAEHWASLAGGDKLAQSVLADRRVLWGTPAEPLPLAQGRAKDALLRALAEQAFTHALPTGFDADAVLTSEGRHSRLDVRSAAGRRPRPTPARARPRSGCARPPTPASCRPTRP